MSRLPFYSRRFQQRRQRHRRGAVLVCVIVILAVASLLLAEMLKRTLVTRRQIRTERHVRQAEWLGQAGAERAAFRLANDAEFTGEKWTLSADAIGGPDSAIVTISVNRGSDDLATVQVVAEYPSGKPTSIRRTRSFLFDLSQTNETGE